MSSQRLLVFTQSIDTSDPVLGFFHGWLRAFAARFPRIHAVCLKEGHHDLPHNVSVYSLGKERGAGRLRFIARFYWIAWKLRREYDAVFVHMNPEYVVLGGVLWRLMGKRVYMWRNHWAKGLLADIAVLLSHKTFCTSRSSYIATYRKNVLMPVGVDTEAFTPTDVPLPHTILSLGRVARSKNIHVMLSAFKLLKDRGIDFSASIYGDAMPKDEEYLRAQKKYVEANGLSGKVVFHSGVKNSETPALYSAHQIFVNASGSGMFDKTIFEAIACGATSVACSKDYRDFAGDAYAFDEGDANQLADRITDFFRRDGEYLRQASVSLRAQLELSHSLAALAARLDTEICV